MIAFLLQLQSSSNRHHVAPLWNLNYLWTAPLQKKFADSYCESQKKANITGKEDCVCMCVCVCWGVGGWVVVVVMRLNLRQGTDYAG